MESLTNIYNEMHDTGDGDVEPTKKDDQSDKEDNEEEGSVIEDEIDNEKDELEIEEDEVSNKKPSKKMTRRTMGIAVYTFMLLDFQKRWNVPIQFGKTMTATIKSRLNTLKQ